MTSLFKRARLTGFALALALGLTVLPGLVAPLLDEEVASWLPDISIALAGDPAGGGG